MPIRCLTSRSNALKSEAIFFRRAQCSMQTEKSGLLLLSPDPIRRSNSTEVLPHLREQHSSERGRELAAIGVAENVAGRSARSAIHGSNQSTFEHERGLVVTLLPAHSKRNSYAATHSAKRSPLPLSEKSMLGLSPLPDISVEAQLRCWGAVPARPVAPRL